MQQGVRNILGKRIKGVVVTEGSSGPRSQVFLIFSDNTYYEFFSFSTIRGISEVCEGGLEEVKDYMPANAILLECCEEEPRATTLGARLCQSFLRAWGCFGAIITGKRRPGDPQHRRST